MSYELPKLKECRSAGDYATALTSIDGRLVEIDTAAGGKPLDDEARAEFSALQGLRKEAVAAKAEVEERSAYIASIADDPKKTERPGLPVRSRTNRSHVPEDIYAIHEYRNLSSTDDELRQAFRDGAMKAAERAVFPHPAAYKHQDEAREQIEVALATIDRNSELSRRILATGSPAYLRAFNKIVAGGDAAMLRLSQEEQRAVMAVGVDATGGFAVPFAFDPTLIHIGAWTNVNPFRANCTVKQIVGTDTWHGVTSTAVTAVRATEALASVNSSPTFAQPEVIVKRVQSLVVFSNEMEQDRPDLASEMASLFAEAKDTEEENSFAVGTGATVNPMGMLSPHANASFTLVETATANTLAIADIDAAEAALPIRYRRDAQWFMNRFVLRTIQGFETVGGRLFNALGNAGYPAVGAIANTPAGNTGLRLLGYPVNEVPSAPADVTTSVAIWAAFGDPKQYLIVDRVGMSVELIPHLLDVSGGTGLPTGQRGLYAMWRNNAKPLNVDGMRRLSIHTT